MNTTLEQIKNHCIKPLPKCGYEKLVAFNGKHYWLTHESRGFRFRESSWILENGFAVLKSHPLVDDQN